MIIRKADKSNISDVQSLMNELQLYRENIFISKNRNFHKRVHPHHPLKKRDLEKDPVFVAIDDLGNVVGFIQGSMHSRKNHVLAKLGYIDELYVQAQYRGEGAAKELVIALEDEFRRQGCDHMTTHTDFENELSRQFYPRIGMQEVTIEFWKEL